MPSKFDLSPVAPKAAKIPVVTQQLGRTRTDDYHWMKDENWQQVMHEPSVLAPVIRAHLDAENSYTQAVLKNAETLKNEIFEEMKGRLEPEDKQVPVPDRTYAYYHRFRKGDQHGLFVRAPIDPTSREINGPEEVVLDADALSAQQEGFFDMGTVAHSPDHSRIVFTIDRKGSENYEIFVQTFGGDAHSTGITTSTGGAEWAANSATLFWTERDENQRPYAVFAKNIDDDAAPALVYKETDPGFFVSVSDSDSGNFIEISAHNHTTSEIWLIPSKFPFTAPRCVSKREAGHEYSLHEQGGYFYILSNSDGATDFQIMRRAVDAPDAKWETFIAHTPGRLILGLEAYKHHLVWMVRENALPRIIICDMRSGKHHDIAFDEAAYGLGLLGGYEYDTPWLRFAYSSPTTPGQVFDYNMNTRERILRKTQSVPSGHNPADYKTERLMITARDGETIPVTLLMRAGTKQDGSAPLLLYGYGSYGITIPAGFRTSILSLVDRGFVYAIAHIRGGMAKGYQGYLDGKLKKKTNTFNDFVDAGRGLCDLGYTRRGRIIAHGGSAGGLLVGAALNQDPALFGGVIAAVPFVDVLTTMSDESLPLTPPEWPEWGNPLTDADAYDRIADYSPYDNVIEAEYPPLLITGGLTDPRVTYWEPAKWAAKLRERQSGSAPVLLKINMDAGHAGEAGRYDSLKEVAVEYAFAVMAAG
ncbi:MAG: S9 family peptidase [Alphaproteobacteria bacterium]